MPPKRNVDICADQVDRMIVNTHMDHSSQSLSRVKTLISENNSLFLKKLGKLHCRKMRLSVMPAQLAQAPLTRENIIVCPNADYLFD